MIKNWKLFKESVDENDRYILIINEICKRYNIENYTINDDFSIDVDGDVDLSYLVLSNIPLKFNRVRGNFRVNNNNLTSLIGCPQWIGGNFSIFFNELSSLKFFPSYLGGNLYCYDNNLTSLEGLSKYIGGYIQCRDNKIWNFVGIPDSFRDEFYCDGNPIFNIWKLFKSSGDIEFFNDCHIIREPETPGGNPIVILERLNFFLETIGKDPVEKVDGYINI
jgi:hypothetical protein